MVSSPYTSPSVDKAWTGLTAELEGFGLPAKEAATLVNALVVAVKSKVRAEIAADFEQLGKRQGSLTWGEAVLIASEGLCVCRGGSKPCDTEGTWVKDVEGGAS